MSDFYALDDEAQAQAMRVLAESALPQWNLEGSDLDLIKYRENAVFAVTTPSGARYALRIHRYNYHTDAELRSELLWMSALAEAGIAVPTLVPTAAGEPFAVVDASVVPEPRQIDIFDWVAGEQLGSCEEGVNDRDAVIENYRTIGSLSARLHNQAVDWALPEGFVRHAWDVEGLVGDAPFWGPFWELEALSDDDRSLLLEARERVRQDLTRYHADPANAGRYSVIHADCVAENLMVEGDQIRLIDFDDAGFGWHLFDLATVLYFEMDEEHFADSLEALIAGYREHRALPDTQVEALPLFFLARGFTYLGWVHTRSETQTAKEMTPTLIEMARKRASEYLGA
tara:strand:- start:406781 stop:407806 length:1026 start_codon:yes stop_codon:yes gene_type:complete